MAWGKRAVPGWIPLRVDLSQCRYRAMVGVGGIGSGSFFALSGNHTLGREESRSGRFLDRRDYCKLHIIAHYIQTLLGPDFKVLPVGKVGDDEPGRQMLEEMGQTGMDLRYVETVAGAQTMYSICFVYPDGAGGNLTTEDSANARVTPDFVSGTKADFAAWQGRGIALAAPEVSLESRHMLLQLATEHGFYRALAVNSAEARSPLLAPMLEKTDFLALNIDEAAAFTGAHDPGPPQEIVEGAASRLRTIKEDLCASITAGKNGNWAWDGKTLHHLPAFPVQVASTAGAGDAHLAGVIVGLVAGLSLFEAQEFGTLVASLSITSPHTIHPAIDRVSLHEFAHQVGASLSEPTLSLLEDGPCFY